MNRVFTSAAYLALEAKRIDGAPVNVLVKQQSIGLISRPIPNSDYSDLTSVYGYPNLGVSGDITPFFLQASEYAADHNQVAAYIRLGLEDMISQPSDPLMHLVDVGEIVTVCLNRDADEIFMSYRQQLRNELRKVPTCTIEESDDIRGFHQIYSENMNRVGARSEYFFSLDYLEQLHNIGGVSLIMAHDDDGPVAGAIVIENGPYLFYHLGATSDNATRNSPMKFVLNKLILDNAHGPFRELVLGGGVGGGSDSLLRFKRAFSKNMKTVQALRMILQPDHYRTLSGSSSDVPFELETGFFPAYRNPLNLEKALYA